MQKVLRKEKSDMKPRLDKLIAKFKSGEMLTRQHLLSIVESRHPIQFEKRFSGGQNNNVCVYQVERLG